MNYRALVLLGDGKDRGSRLEDMLNANVSPPVSYTLAETIGWILFDMDEQYALFLSQPLSSVL